MNKLSIFVDESGDFGKYNENSPYYIFTMIFHNQSTSMVDMISNLYYKISEVSERKLVHCWPLIRREEMYQYIDLKERRKIFNSLYFFSFKAPITYKEIVVNKKECNEEDEMSLSTKLVKQLSAFIKDNMNFFVSFDQICVYYDNGQIELARIIHNTFQTLLSNVTFKKIIPDAYKLQQVADLFCTLVLLSLKAKNNNLSMSEKWFFESQNKLKKDYLKILKKKAFL